MNTSDITCNSRWYVLLRSVDVDIPHYEKVCFTKDGGTSPGGKVRDKEYSQSQATQAAGSVSIHSTLPGMLCEVSELPVHFVLNSARLPDQTDNYLTLCPRLESRSKENIEIKANLFRK